MDYLDTGPVSFKIPAEHRALIYTFGVGTGLRFAAIQRMTVKRLEMNKDRPSVFVPKSNRIKYSADRWIPLSNELWSLVKPLVEDRPPTELIFKMPTRGHGSKMVKKDLDRARSQWISDAETSIERAKREASDFLRYQDSDGKFVDFHALAVWLFAHHGAEGRDVQDLMGLGSLSLVDRYARSFKGSHRKLVNSGPELRPKKEVSEASSDETGIDVLPESCPQASNCLPPSLPQKGKNWRISPDSAGQAGFRTSADFTEQDATKTPIKLDVLTPPVESVSLSLPLGEVAEWLNAPVSKTG